MKLTLFFSTRWLQTIFKLLCTRSIMYFCQYHLYNIWPCNCAILSKWFIECYDVIMFDLFQPFPISSSPFYHMSGVICWDHTFNLLTYFIWSTWNLILLIIWYFPNVNNLIIWSSNKFFKVICSKRYSYVFVISPSFFSLIRCKVAYINLFIITLFR